MKVANREEMEKASSSKSSFLKLKQGDTTVRVVSDIHVVKEHPTEFNKKIQFTACPHEMHKLALTLGHTQERVPKGCPLCEKGYPVQTKYMAVVINRADGLPYILKASKKTFDEIQGYAETPEWGDYRRYDIKISGTGDGLDRRYQVKALPVKEETAELTEDEKAMLVDFGIDDTLEKMTTPLSEEEIVKKIMGEEGAEIPEYIPF